MFTILILFQKSEPFRLSINSIVQIEMSMAKNILNIILKILNLKSLNVRYAEIIVSKTAIIAYIHHFILAVHRNRSLKYLSINRVFILAARLSIQENIYFAGIFLLEVVLTMSA